MNHRRTFAAMILIMRYPFFLLMLLTVISSCNSGEQKNTEPAGAVSREKEMQEAIARYPDSLLLRENLSQYYRDSGVYDKAIAVISEALRKDSNNARLWDIKATLHFENEDTANAISAFEHAVAIVPAPEYLMSLGSLYAQTKNSKALLVANVLAKPQTGNTAKEALFIEGLYYSYSGDKIKAISFFDRCLAMEYSFMFAYREKAIALYDLGKYEEALRVLDKAVTLQNNFDEGYYWKGRCLEKLNKNAEAIEEYRTALLYSPDFVEAKAALTRLGGS